MKFGKPKLLPRKTRVEIKRLYAEGHSTKSIAEALSVSEPAVIRHTREIARRLKKAEAEATLGAMITIQSTTRSNVALGATLVNKHLTEVLKDSEKVKNLSIEDVQQYAKLSGNELTKLQLIEGVTPPPEQGRIASPGGVTVNLLAQYQAADIIPHKEGKLELTPALPLPAQALPAPEPSTEKGDDAPSIG